MTEQTPAPATQTIYYWSDAYWTRDKEEAEEADKYGIYCGKHSTLEVAETAETYDIDRAVIDALEAAEQEPTAEHTVAPDTVPPTVCDRAHTVEEGGA